jgi:hypothetical protein
MIAYAALFVPHQHWRYVIEAQQPEQEPEQKPKGEGERVIGVDPELAKMGVTPLMSAASGNQLDVVRYILARRADKYARTHEGFTAFDFAAYNGSEALTRLLWTGLSPMSDTAVKLAMDDAGARMNWDICLIRLSRPSGDQLMLNDVLPTDGESRRSALVNRKPRYACDQIVESYRSALKNPFPFMQAQPTY